MAHPYALERPEREAFIERSLSVWQTALRREDVQAVLDETLLEYVQGVNSYTPLVSESGVVTVPPTYNDTDHIPILALRDHETVERDATFATFTPEQWGHAPDKNDWDIIADQVAASSLKSRLAQTFTEEAAVMRLMYGRRNYLEGSQVTYFNLRPLILLRYRPEVRHSYASTLASSYVFCHHIVTHPMIVTDETSAHTFNELNAQWREKGRIVGSLVGRILSEEA